MLGLRHATPPSFVDRFESHLEEMLLDHAHCEKKAAATALNLLARYPDQPELVARMAEIVEEEIVHFRQVLDVLAGHGWEYRGLSASGYAGKLHAHVRKGYDEACVDRLLISAMIEARSCERFALLGDHLADARLRAFYRSLFESEARHYATYVKLALGRMPEDVVRARLSELLDIEAAIVAQGDETPRLHS